MLRSTIFGQAFSPLMHYRPVGFWQSGTQLKQLVCSLCATLHTAQENRTGANRQEIEGGGDQRTAEGRVPNRGHLFSLFLCVHPRRVWKGRRRENQRIRSKVFVHKRSLKKDMLGMIFASEMRGRSDLTLCRVTTKSLSISTFPRPSNIIPLLTA